MENSNPNEYSTRMPKLGEQVIFFPNPDDTVARSNNAKVCVAFVTAPWSSIIVNLKIMPDHGPIQDRGSVSHFSANPAGYHFMFQDEYEAFLKVGYKDPKAIKRQLIDEADQYIIEANEHLKKATESRLKARECVNKVKDIRGKENGTWIKISERKPEYGVRVLVKNEKGQILKYALFNHKGIGKDGSDEDMWNTHEKISADYDDLSPMVEWLEEK